MALCRRVMAAHKDSVVKIGCRKKLLDREKPTKGTGFIVHMDPSFCLVMTCGHVLEDRIDGSIHVSFGKTMIPARVVFADCDKEVSMVRVDKSSNPVKFATVADYPPVLWSAQEAQRNNLVAVVSRMSDAEGHLCRDPSVFHGTVCVPPRRERKKKKKDKDPLYLGTADYSSVKGNSGSAIFNQDLKVVGIHVSAVDLMARFVCLKGVALVMEEYLKMQAVSVDAKQSASVAYLLAKIVETEIARPSFASAGGSSSGAGPSSSAGAGAP